MNISEQHRLTYDLLAPEYVARADDLRSVTEHAVDKFACHLTTGRVLDIGCGAGLLVEVLGERGYVSEGIDISHEMVKAARIRNPAKQIYEGDFLEYNFAGQYDGIFAFAFIHLYPRKIAQAVLGHVHESLKPNGVLYIGTTESEEPSEGFERKRDYSDTKQLRFRKHWTRAEFISFLGSTGLEIIDDDTIEDPFGKRWMDFILRKNPNEST